MTTVSELRNKEKMMIDARSNGSGYVGHTIYRGEKVRQDHSLRRISKTLLSFLDQTQFASVNIVGIPGSGKTTLTTNLITDLVEMAEKKNNEIYAVHWAGPEELRNLGEYIDNLQKGANHIVAFDDVSKALDKLKASEQADVFEQLTTTRHVTGGKLLMISLYHYSYANLKSVKAQSVVSIYTSCTLTEKQNIANQLGKDRKALNKLKFFTRIYQDSMSKKSFDLYISPNKMKTFETGKPFRPCFVINLSRAHLSLFMKLDNGFVPSFTKKQTIDSKLLTQEMKRKYGRYGTLALKFFCLVKGHTTAVDKTLLLPWLFLHDLRKTYGLNTKELTEILQNYDTPNKRTYRPRGEEKEFTKLLIDESRELLDKSSNPQ